MLQMAERRVRFVGRGAPKLGFRRTKQWTERAKQAGFDPDKLFADLKAGTVRTNPVPVKVWEPKVYRPATSEAPKPKGKRESDKQIEARIGARLETIRGLVKDACEGRIRSLIVSGPPGLSKSYTVEETVQAWDKRGNKHLYVKGYVRALGLYKMLWHCRHPGRVLILDDADTIFNDETSLNFIKAACDSAETRRLHYKSQAILEDDETGELIPKKFVFEGTVIFITNYDFHLKIAQGAKHAMHFEALTSRAYYIDCAMHTKRDYLVCIKMLCRDGMLRKQGLTNKQTKLVIKYITENQDRLADISLRVALKIATLMRIHPRTWRQKANITCCKVGAV